MNVGIIGCGSIGSRHANNAQAQGHQVRIWDSDTRRATHSWTDVVWKSDALMLCTPANTHAQIARQVLTDVGTIPLFVEKPLALSVADCKVFRSWPASAFMIGYNWRFHPEVVAFRMRYPNPFHLHLMCDTDMRTWPGSASQGDPRLECSHELDLLQWWRGAMPVLGYTSACSPMTGEEGCFYQFQSALIDVRWQAPPIRRIQIEMPNREQHLLWPSHDGPALDQSYRDELAHFLRAVEGGPIAPGCTLSEGIRVLEVIEQAKAMSAAHV